MNLSHEMGEMGDENKASRTQEDSRLFMAVLLCVTLVSSKEVLFLLTYDARLREGSLHGR
jgi:hypothetical protein